jgi:RNA polymerase sigma-70 factor (ECF subfamily)
MNTADADLDGLLARATAGDDAARQRLLGCFRDRLRRMVGVHLDRRLAARVDPSDVVQEALADAARKLDDYLCRRPLPFYPWLRRLAWERVLKQHQRHIHAGKRSVCREEMQPPGLPESSALELTERLLDRRSGPSARLVREEQRALVRAALDRLGEGDREVLVLRYLEGLSHHDIAAVLGVGEAAVKTRHVRALDRLGELLNEESEEADHERTGPARGGKQR